MGWRWRRRPSDSEIEEEMEAHLGIEARRRMEAGLSREEAEWGARREMGSKALAMERTREVWGGRWERVWQDVRYAGRVLLRERAFTGAAILSMALGIGAATAVFSIGDTIFLRPLPYGAPERLAWVGVRFPSVNQEFVLSPDYVAWRRDNRVFEQLAAMRLNGADRMVLGGAGAEEVSVAAVSANFLDALGLRVQTGRTFTAREELPNGEKAVVISGRFWREHFGGRREALGSRVALDGEPYTVVGVLPRGFVYPYDGRVDMLRTLPVDPAASHQGGPMATWAVFGRLRAGVSLSEARADMARLFALSRADFPLLLRGDNTLDVETLQEHRAKGAWRAMLLLAWGAVCLLAISCVNVANLLLARWSAREGELAVRAALGAGRARLSRQLAMEAGVLTAAGGAAAMAVSAAAIWAVARYAGGELPRLAEAAVDWRVFRIALLISAATALASGGLPALGAGKMEPMGALRRRRAGSGAGGHLAARRALVVAEVAMAAVLVTAAALLGQSLWHLQRDHLGFDPEHVLTVTIPMRGGWREGEARRQVGEEVEEILRRAPGTEAVSGTVCTPFSGWEMLATFSRADRPHPAPYHRGDNIGVCGVGAGYLRALGGRMVEGRFFDAADESHPGSVAVINESAARAYFAGESAVGKKILGWKGQDWRTVVGVMADIKNRELNRPAAPEALINEVGSGDLRFIVRTQAKEGLVAAALSADLRARHAGLFAKVETIDETIGALSAGPRFNAALAGAFGVIALATALAGVYGVLAYSVARRRREFGIRMALGAARGAVMGMMMREAAGLAGAGILAGLCGALALARAMGSMLYGVGVSDGRTLALVGMGLGAATLAATWWPTRRAGRVDPVEVLREE